MACVVNDERDAVAETGRVQCGMCVLIIPVEVGLKLKATLGGVADVSKKSINASLGCCKNRQTTAVQMIWHSVTGASSDNWSQLTVQCSTRMGSTYFGNGIDGSEEMFIKTRTASAVA